jgi:hypothetical protein
MFIPIFVDNSYSDSGHLGFRINIKNKYNVIVKDHPMIIREQFGFNQVSSF